MSGTGIIKLLLREIAIPILIHHAHGGPTHPAPTRATALHHRPPMTEYARLEFAGIYSSILVLVQIGKLHHAGQTPHLPALFRPLRHPLAPGLDKLLFGQESIAIQIEIPERWRLAASTLAHSATGTGLHWYTSGTGGAGCFPPLAAYLIHLLPGDHTIPVQIEVIERYGTRLGHRYRHSTCHQQGKQ
jgi:hypothetical protein